MRRHFILRTALVVLIFGLSGCLKTRAQLRDETTDDKEGNRPVAVQPAHDVPMQGQYVIDEIKSEFTRLEGRVEDLERNQKGEKSVPLEEYRRLEERVISLEQAQADLLAKVHESSQPVDPSELLKKAKTQYADGDYEGTTETLGAYFKAKPKKPEEAYFLKGECHFKLKQYKKAIVEYSKFPEKYTRSTHVPEALLKIGMSFEALGMKDDAKGFYQELVEKFPKSPEAKKARKKVK